MTDWYVLNAKDAQWSVNEMGWYCNFEEGERFPELGINLNVLPPGKPMAMYHNEPYQEGFLVLDGEAVLIIDGQERPLRKWDYVHCPRDVPHVVVGAGQGALVLAVGSRVGPDGGGYPHEPLAVKYGASAEEDTDDARVAYAAYSPPENRPYPEGLLPD
jgi:uncharacterized cupin superfamily protein